MRGRPGLAARAQARELDERTRRGRAGDDLLRDRAEDGLQRSRRGRWRLGGLGRRRHGLLLLTFLGFDFGLHLGLDRRGRRGGLGGGGRRSLRFGDGRGRRHALGGTRLDLLGGGGCDLLARGRRRGLDVGFNDGLARDDGGGRGLGGGRRRGSRGLGRDGRRAGGHGLRATTDDRVVEPLLDRALLALARDGAPHAIDVGRLEVRHVVGDLDAERSHLGDHLSVAEGQLLGELVDANARTCRGLGGVSASDHGLSLFLTRKAAAAAVSCCKRSASSRVPTRRRLPFFENARTKAPCFSAARKQAASGCSDAPRPAGRANPDDPSPRA